MTDRRNLLGLVATLAMLGAVPESMPEPRRRRDPEPLPPMPYLGSDRPPYDPPGWMIERDRLAAKHIAAAEAKRARKAARLEAAATKGAIRKGQS